MKLFQVQNGLATVDFTQHGPSKKDIKEGMFPESLINELYDAPDYVHIGYGFNYDTKEWVKPETPEGFDYDPESGTLYPNTQEYAAYRQQKLYTYVYIGVIDGTISREQFLKITGEEYIEPCQCENCGPAKVEGDFSGLIDLYGIKKE